MVTTVKTGSLICENLARTEDGELTFAGVRLSPLAQKYGTPLYLYDENRIRERIKSYVDSANRAFSGNAKVLYASKAASFKRIYEIASEEGIGIDVVSSGEIYTAKMAGFPLSQAYFHSNNKTDYDVEYAISEGIGYFVVDNAEELYREIRNM